MRLWPDYIRSRRSSITVLLLCTIFTILVTGTYATPAAQARPDARAHRLPRAGNCPARAGILPYPAALRAEGPALPLCPQPARRPIAHPLQPLGPLYPGPRASPDHPLSFRVPGAGLCRPHRPGYPDIKNTLPTIEVCITPARTDHEPILSIHQRDLPQGLAYPLEDHGTGLWPLLNRQKRGSIEPLFFGFHANCGC